MMSLAACIRRCPSTTRWPWLANSLLPRNGSSTEACASLACRNSGSSLSRPSMRMIQARVPTLPTPTTLRAASTKRKRSSSLRRSPESVRRYERISACNASWACSPSGRRTSSSSRHDQRRVADDPRLAVDGLGQLVEGREAVLRAGLGDVLVQALLLLGRGLRRELRNDLLDVDAVVPEIQVPHPGVARASPRGNARADHLVDLVRASSSSKPRSRPATAKLATSRLTSHSNGPGSVSSKSLMLKTSRRSGAAKTPKFDRCASPQSCVCRPVRGTAREIGRHQVGRAAIERERRDQHPAVADRHELGHPRCGLLLEQLDRVRPVRRRLPLAVTLPRHLGARRPFRAPRAPRR